MGSRQIVVIVLLAVAAVVSAGEALEVGRGAWMLWALAALQLIAIAAVVRGRPSKASLAIGAISAFALLHIAMAIPDHEEPTATGNVNAAYITIAVVCVFWIGAMWAAKRLSNAPESSA